jgi:hypothetical protein
MMPHAIGAEGGPCEIMGIFDRDARRGHQRDTGESGDCGARPRGRRESEVQSWRYFQGVSDAGTVAYLAHIVGFLAGMLIAWPLRPGTPPPPEPRGLLLGRRARPGW